MTTQPGDAFGFRRRTSSHRTVIAVDSPVGTQKQGTVEQLTIDVLQRQPSSATFADDSQDGVPIAVRRPAGFSIDQLEFVAVEHEGPRKPRDFQLNFHMPGPVVTHAG